MSAGPTDQQLYDAYVYTLGRALVIRQETTDLAEEGVDYNTIKYNPVGSADFVNPNLDVAYLESWIAVDERSPATLTVPRITGRYYTAQLLDEWGEVIANINEREFPDAPYGDFVLHAPGAAPTCGGVPVELHSNKAKMLARVEIGDDIDGAVALQRAFVLASSGSPHIDPPVPLPTFNNSDLLGVELFEFAEEIFASAPEPTRALLTMQDQAMQIAAYVASSPDARGDLDSRIATEVVPRVLRESATNVNPSRNGWLLVNTAGHYGANYPTRTAANLLGIWANVPEEVVYYLGTRDSAGEAYAGGKSYSLTFPSDALPADQANAYWSIILVSVPDYRVIANPLGRYNLNSYSDLRHEHDGSLRIDISPEPPGGPETNWLPSPSTGAFALTVRLYRPTRDPIAGEWFPPALIDGGSSNGTLPKPTDPAAPSPMGG